jgi:hypothetical protein
MYEPTAQTLAPDGSQPRLDAERTDGREFAAVGNEILPGDAILTVLTGGADQDTFVIDTSALMDVGMADVIADYNKAEGDVLDLGSLLQAAFGSNAPTTAADADAVVNLVVNGGNTDVVIDTNGADNPDPAGEIVVTQLTGVYTAINILYDDGSATEVS